VKTTTNDPRPVDLQRILMSTKVGELTLKVRLKLSPTDSVAAAAALMRNRSHGSALICVDEKLVGIFTERDLLRLIAAGRDLDTPLSEVMTSSPQTVTLNDTLFEAIRLMDQGGYRRVPVVDDAGAPVGLVDVKTASHFLVEHFPSAVYNQASNAQLTARNREGA
jgi:CBS domain-containing protein